ncbi:FAD:protein FMN transferase [Streptomyces zhihengii]|uniref:FAD:protein FMN transferase n=1 Tax=Streptomyces zhihengii TaxID=1818004 RepID=A0ABS2V316_9ACTN|nr:FAD:protein FMN transferase [Streptomyces zhihengii]MBM9624245.1 FAD:protein FMN transferase [Streptomyces zhihengii]
MTPHDSAVAPSRVAFPALGTAAVLLVTDPAVLRTAEAVLRAELAAVDLACSRFRPDSELTRVNVSAGVTTTVGEYFSEALQSALRVARLTGGAVDPTVGSAVIASGYDRSFASLSPEDVRPVPVARPAPGWRRIAFDPRTRRLRLPPGTRLDLGATAKALAADRAARQIGRVTDCGVLVSLGGDLATAGPAPEGGWTIGLADDHAQPVPQGGPAVAVTGGALATSGIRVRTWRRCGRVLHHIVDPVTGDPAVPVWRTVTVAAATCLDANAMSTASIVLGERAPDWLRATGLPARLTALDGTVTRVGGWPLDAGAPDSAGSRGTSHGGPR